jgi:TRAP-type C4-dicarboxylate transport system permease large subunit
MTLKINSANPEEPNVSVKRSRYIPAFLIFSLLSFVVVLGLGDSIHSRLLNLGENLWEGYYLLDPDAEQPSCNVNQNIELSVKVLMAEQLADSADDLFDDDLFSSDTGASEQDFRDSLTSSLAMCQAEHKNYHFQKSRITPTLENFKSVETSVADFLIENIDIKEFLLVIMLFICAFIATVRHHHIALWAATNANQRQVSTLFQLMANSLIAISFWHYRVTLSENSGTNHALNIQMLFLICFSVLAITNLVQLSKNFNRIVISGSNLLSIPLYVLMCLISSAYFILVDDHISGIAIYINQLTNLSNIFLNIGLYVFIGMTLKETAIPKLIFDLVRPFHLAPPLFASLIIFVTAYPTAFTGASGIFVLAIGGLLYEELRAAGTRRTLAFATTAMSGSLGVVLNPCLLIVIIAALNKEVTTTEMYSWGFTVFMLSAIIFSAIVLITNRQPWMQMESWDESKKQIIATLKKLAPYALIVIAVLVGFNLLLDITMNEYSAPLVLPVILSFILAYEQLWLKKTRRTMRFLTVGTKAADEASVHIGALLSLIALSICLGGVLERSDVMMHFFGDELMNPWITMTICILLLTFIGMFMDPFGAVILVSATFASQAMASGIEPIHFWMVSLVAFELGYLSPPVALNHLLARQVIGEKELQIANQDNEGKSLFRRYERILLPLITMLITLVIVGFGPLFVYL